ncbi:MAG: hypothetical protein HY875_03615 [Chloroflexi bacterium]|nr:hypothetical protein [Chloroflexota bacterium]
MAASDPPSPPRAQVDRHHRTPARKPSRAPQPRRHRLQVAGTVHADGYPFATLNGSVLHVNEAFADAYLKLATGAAPAEAAGH